MTTSLRHSLFYWWIPTILLTILAYFIQSHIYLHRDIAAVLHATSAMLHGETYGNNIFEPSPPMILYLSIPALFLAKLLSISAVSAIRIYFLVLAFISINFSRFIIKKLFEKNNLLIYLLNYTLVYVLLFLPSYHFAQREHFLLALILPYLFLTALRLENKKVHFMFAVLIGLMAGMGFSIKPHFLSAFFFIEMYYLYKKRDLFAWMKIETLCITGVICTYIMAIILFYPSYIHEVLPLWINFYKSIIHPISEILMYQPFIYCVGIIILYLTTRKFNQYNTLCELLLFALLGFICSYLFPRVAWYYHIFPALGISSLLMIIIMGQIIQQISLTKYTAALFIAMIGILNFIPLNYNVKNMIEKTNHFNSKNYFSDLIQFFKENGKNTTFSYFSMTHEYMLLEFYAPAHFVGRFSILMWEYNQAFIHFSPNKKIASDEKNIPYLINLISQELNEDKPKFVIMDIPSSTFYLNMKVNYIEKYQKYKSFRTAWKSYHYLKTIGPVDIYERKYT